MNLQVCLGNIDILTIFRPSTHEHSRSNFLHLFRSSLIFLINVSYFSAHKSYIYFVRLIPKFFMLFQIVMSLNCQVAVVLCQHIEIQLTSVCNVTIFNLTGYPNFARISIASCCLSKCSAQVTQRVKIRIICSVN